MIKFYCGINETQWNHHATEPGGMACISPVYGRSERTHTENAVKIPDDCIVLQDSGAFCDGPNNRLSFADALKRQIAHAEKYNYADQVEYVASYDLLIDEKWNGGIRHKSRWTESEADAAVTETVGAAGYISAHRDEIRRGQSVVLSAQGVTADQYCRCLSAVCEFAEPGDCIGLGGWCITGKMPAVILPSFYAMIEGGMGIISESPARRAHIWGVIYAPALGPLLWICDQYNIVLSTDSAGPQIKPAAFGEWGYAEWRDANYKKAPVELLGLERARHVKQTRNWLENFRDTEWYRPPWTFSHYQFQRSLW